jgi:membrane associated rhomboid family serine protease
LPRRAEPKLNPNQDPAIENPDWKIVFESPARGACTDRSLVLHSLGIPYDVLQHENRFVLVVPVANAEKAKYELWQYDAENQPAKKPGPRVKPVYQSGLYGAVGYVVVISMVAVLAADTAFNRDWFTSGRVDGVLIRAGEWWRTITALTLHSGFRHFAGNLGFGVFFGMMAARVLGPGVTWLAVVFSASVANFINTLLLDSTHRAIGASTGVFAALGLVAGFIWRARLLRQDRWADRIGPLVGGIALLAFTGTGDANTDVGAHLAGFVCGLVTGMLLTLVYPWLTSLTIQRVAGGLAVATVAGAWFVAL